MPTTRMLFEAAHVDCLSQAWNSPPANRVRSVK
jgi:hypothetical protein